MAKRFTDTDIWKKSWYRKMPPKMKEAWRFITENCNHAGIWDFDLEIMSFLIGEEISREEFDFHFSDKVLFIKDDKILITKFIIFQYVQLNEANRTHNSVLNILKSEGVSKDLIRSLQGVKDKDKDKDKGKYKDKDKVKGFRDAWNQNCGKLPKVLKTNKSRDDKIGTRLIEVDDLEYWIETIIRLSESNFCNGVNESAWVATFDWFLKPDTHLRINEGKYDNRNAVSKKTAQLVDVLNKIDKGEV